MVTSLQVLHWLKLPMYHAYTASGVTFLMLSKRCVAKGVVQAVISGAWWIAPTVLSLCS